MANIRICTKCGRIGLEQYDFYIRWHSQNGKYCYWSRCDGCIKEHRKKYQKQYYQDNKEHLKEYRRQYSRNNPEKVKECNNQWKKDNRVKVNQYNRNQRALKKGAEGSHTIEDRRHIYKHQSGKCLCCGKKFSFEELTEDHIIPLSWGGTNYAWNIQLLCRSCNCAKKNYHATNYNKKEK